MKLFQNTALRLVVAVVLLSCASIGPAGALDRLPPVRGDLVFERIAETPEAEHFRGVIQQLNTAVRVDAYAARVADVLEILEIIEAAHGDRADFPADDYRIVKEVFTAVGTGLAAPILPTPNKDFTRGDANNDGRIDLSDGVQILNALFTGSAGFRCVRAADTNDSGNVDISDAAYLLGALFLGSANPPAPFPSCGTDTTSDALNCFQSVCADSGRQEFVARSASLSYHCEGGVCICIGDDDCNGMFTDDVCHGLEYCSDLLGIPYCACLGGRVVPPVKTGGVGGIGGIGGVNPPIAQR